jgi:hypothetical protein
MGSSFVQSATELCRIAADLGNSTWAEVMQLARELLVFPTRGGEDLGYHSTLNNDGSPLQVCVSSSCGHVSVRLIADPAAFVRDLSERFQNARIALFKLFSLAAMWEIAPVCEHVLRLTLPADQGRIAHMMSGTLWLALSLDARGAALYVNPRWGSESEQWDRASSLVRTLLSAAEPAIGITHGLRERATLASIALEGSSLTDLRLKLYWRLRKPTLLSSLGVPLLADPAFAEFLLQTLGDRTISSSGLVFCVGFSVGTGILQDAKVDVCAHCISQTPSVWERFLKTSLDKFELQPLGLDGVLTSRLAEVAMIGFALDSQRRKRLNVYLKGCNAR